MDNQPTKHSEQKKNIEQKIQIIPINKFTIPYINNPKISSKAKKDLNSIFFM